MEFIETEIISKINQDDVLLFRGHSAFDINNSLCLYVVKKTEEGIYVKYRTDLVNLDGYTIVKDKNKYFTEDSEIIFLDSIIIIDKKYNFVFKLSFEGKPILNELGIISFIPRFFLNLTKSYKEEIERKNEIREKQKVFLDKL